MDRKALVYSKNFNSDDYAVRAILLYLIQVFKVNEELDFPPYTDEQNKIDSFTSTLFTTKFDWETKYRGKRPVVIVSCGNTLIGVNNTLGSAKIRSVTENGQVINYTDLISLSILVQCLSEADLEANSLASAVLMFLTADARPLHSLGLQLQGNPIKTPVRIFEKGTISFIAQVIINVQMQGFISKLILLNLSEK